MKFGNPTSSSAVANAVSAVFALSQKSFYWPQIQGQPFAPSLGSNSGYSAAGGQSAITIGDASLVTAVFPEIPRFLFGSKQTVVLTAIVQFFSVFGPPFAGTPQINPFLYTFNDSAVPGIELASTISQANNNAVIDLILNPGGNIIQAGFFTASYATWYVIAITMNGDGSGKIVVTDINGNIAASHTFAANTFPILTTRIKPAFGPPDASHTGSTSNVTALGPLTVVYS